MAIDLGTLNVALKSISDFARQELPDARLIELDEHDEFPEDLVRRMSSADELGIQMLFVPYEYGGMGGGAFDVYRVCERMAGIDLGIATSELATFLGSDPIRVGGTEAQKRQYMGRIAKDGILFAYGATEPEAGSDLGALKTTAEPVGNGDTTGYRISGVKQWISNGGVADCYTILAMAPGGPSWFVVESGVDGFTHGKHEDKHGIRLSNTAALFLDKVYVDADSLIGGVEGQGLVQAQQVFGYTRLMVAAFGLGAGWSALDRAIPYSRTRIQAGGPLSEKEGYTYKLIVPHVVALEAARAAIEETAARIDDGGEGSLNVEGAIAKLLATEAGDRAADAAIQAHGGYGYTHDYIVEKIKRDVRITRIYEGTSEIMEMTIARGRWQEHLKSGGEYYRAGARELEALHVEHPEVGADVAALAHHALAELLERVRSARLTRHQHILLRLGAIIAEVEGAAALARRAAQAATGQLHEKAAKRLKANGLAAASRVNARTVAMTVATEGVRWVAGSDAGELGGFEQQLGLAAIHRAQGGLMADLAMVNDAIYAMKPRRA